MCKKENQSLMYGFIILRGGGLKKHREKLQCNHSLKIVNNLKSIVVNGISKFYWPTAM